ncbi:hypothetical protein EON73_02045 [bacterium]|nr:MAG: hypothetical protein EON73_02045 [bacterium]
MKLIAFIFTLHFILSSNTCIAQGAQELKKISSFFQTHSDTTLLLKDESNWIQTPRFWLISKKADTISAYQYGLDKLDLPRMPNAIAQHMFRINYMASMDIDVNPYLKALPSDKHSLDKMWAALLKFTPWTIRDDSTDGHACDGRDSKIYDAGGISLTLITKKDIRRLYFYAPSFYESSEGCPGRDGRLKIIEIKKLFDDLFRK